MSTQLVISALGADRPGIVDELSNIVYTHKLNIKDSRMTVLGGEFAILLLLVGEKTDILAFIEQQARIEEALQIQLLMKTTQTVEADSNIIPYLVEVTAMDHQGIVHNLAGFFSSKKINIVNLHTDHYPAPHTGTPMFGLAMTIGIPADTQIAQLKDEFTRFCDELNLDAELKSL